MSDKIFSDGIWFNDPHERAPDYVKGQLSIDDDRFIEFLKEHRTNGKTRLEIKKGRNEKNYLELYVKPEEQPQIPPEEESQDPDDHLDPDDPLVSTGQNQDSQESKDPMDDLPF